VESPKMATEEQLIQVIEAFRDRCDNLESEVRNLKNRNDVLESLVSKQNDLIEVLVTQTNVLGRLTNSIDSLEFSCRKISGAIEERSYNR